MPFKTPLTRARVSHNLVIKIVQGTYLIPLNRTIGVIESEGLACFGRDSKKKISRLSSVFESVVGSVLVPEDENQHKPEKKQISALIALSIMFSADEPWF